MSTLDDLRKRLLETPLGVGAIAAQAEVDRSTVRRVRDGKMLPSITLFESIDNALDQLGAHKSTPRATKRTKRSTSLSTAR